MFLPVKHANRLTIEDFILTLSSYVPKLKFFKSVRLFQLRTRWSLKPNFERKPIGANSRKLIN